MDDNDSQDREPPQGPGSLRRTTEQGDDLTEEHSLFEGEERAERPYAPPRQPAGDPPAT